jgi:cytochrome c biogenesis protein CcmG, thiol:disulfide interchange protein DsbE
MRLKFFLPVVLFAGLAAFLYAGLFRDPSLVPSVMIGKAVRDFDLPPVPLPDGESRPGLSAANLKGEPTLVNFFATWCIPCKEEHPLLERLAGTKLVPIYGVDYKDKPGAAAVWLKELGNPYTRIGVDADGRVAIDWGVYGVPESYVVDGSGIIRYRHVGPLTTRDLDDKIVPLIKSLKK